MPTAPATPTIPRVLRRTRVVLRVDGELHERLAWITHAHGYADLEECVLDLLTDAACNEHQHCPECRRVARGGRPARVP